MLNKPKFKVGTSVYYMTPNKVKRLSKVSHIMWRLSEKAGDDLCEFVYFLQSGTESAWKHRESDSFSIPCYTEDQLTKVTYTRKK